MYYEVIQTLLTSNKKLSKYKCFKFLFYKTQFFVSLHITKNLLIIQHSRCTGLSIGSIMVRLGGIFLLYVDIDTLKYPWMFYSAVTILGKFLNTLKTF